MILLWLDKTFGALNQSVCGMASDVLLETCHDNTFHSDWRHVDLSEVIPIRVHDTALV
jgi:hypothetical protein